MATSEFSGGIWLALIAGSAPWEADDQRIGTTYPMTAFLEVVALLAAMGTVWRASLAAPGDRMLPGTIATAAVAVLIVAPLLRLLNREPLSRRVSLNLLVRAAMISALALSMYAVLHGWMAMFLVPLSVALGADMALTASALGWRPNPLRWWYEFLFSAFHLGILGALVATSVTSRGHHLHTVLPLFVAMHFCVIVTLTVAWCIWAILRRSDAVNAAIIAGVKEDERRNRAHWLHDDVCAQLRLVSLQVQTEATGTADVVRLLDEFDHSLRLRQLDELFATGSVRIAEVLQPFIRHAQNRGVEINSVPAFEQAALVLNESEARILARAAGMLTSNALNAGATRLTYAVDVGGHDLRLTVRDNGSGFPPDALQPGRGLWILREDLVPGGVEINSTPTGSAVVAVIPLNDRKTYVANTAG